MRGALFPGWISTSARGDANKRGEDESKLKKKILAERALHYLLMAEKHRR